MRVTDIPMPAAVATRPREERGYPIPAITPWIDGRPKLATTGVARTFICAVERRCSICGTAMPDGPVWRVVAGPEADAIADAIRAGQPFNNLEPTLEAPGHRACMLYAAVTCPYLSAPTARRGIDAPAAGLDLTRGAKRGHGGAVVGFLDYDFTYLDVVRFEFKGLYEFRRHEYGTEQVDALAAEVAQESGKAPQQHEVRAPDYLLTDETQSIERFQWYLTRLSGQRQ